MSGPAFSAARCRAAVLAPLCALVWGVAHCVAASAASPHEPPGGVEAQRLQIEAKHEVRRKACATRFAVSSCMDEALGERRRELAALAARQAALDDAERRRRAQARQARIEAKQTRRAAAERERASAPWIPMQDGRPVGARPRRADAAASAASAP